MLFKRPVLLFFTIVSSLVIAALGLIQSPQFADIVKQRLAAYVPAGLGLNGDFSEFEINLFPPGVSVTNPRLRLEEDNALGLPADSDIVSERLDLNFYPLQMLTGNVRVHEVVLATGSIRFEVDAEALTATKLPSAPTEEPQEFRWDQLFKIKTEAVVFQDTTFELKVKKPDLFLRFKANQLRLGQWYGRGGLGYRLGLSIEDVFVESGKVEIPPNLVQALELDVAVNPRNLELNNLRLVGPETNLSLKGELEGNVLESKDLPFEGSITGNARLESWPIPAAIKRRLSTQPKGRVSFEASGSGRTGDLLSTLELDLELTGKEVSVEGWDANELILDASWEARDQLKYGYAQLNRFEVSSLPRARTRLQSARGGRLKVLPFEGPIDFRSKPPKVVAELESAHLHWLLGPVAKGLHGLQISPTGRLEFTFEPDLDGDSWRLLGSGEIAAPDIVYDNLKLGEKEEPLSIVEGRKLRLPIQFELNKDRVDFTGTQVLLTNTSFDMKGGIDFEKGLDMEWDGPVNFTDVPIIAGNQIRGEGRVKTILKGAGDRVLLSFEPDLEEARFLNLNLGNLAGEIIYDDAGEALRFVDLKGKHIGTEYVGNGSISLKEPSETIDMTVEVPKGQIENLFDVFESLHRKFWWFPRTLVGPVRGRIEIKGGLQLSEISILGDLSGRDWDFWREKFTSVRLTGGYKQGSFVISRLDAQKSDSLIKATVGFEEESENLSWSLRSERLMVRDIDRISRLDVPVDGFLTVYSEGSGNIDRLSSRTDIGVYGFSIRGNEFPDARLRADLKSSELVVNGTADDKVVALQLRYPFKKGAPAKLDLELSKFDFSPLILVVNSDLARDPKLRGVLSGDVKVAFPSGDFLSGDGSFGLSKFELSKEGFGARLTEPLRSKVTRGDFAQTRARFKFDGLEEPLKIVAFSEGRRLGGTLEGPIDIGIAEFFTDSIERRAGSVDINWRLGGTTERPLAKGGIVFNDGEIRVGGLDSPIQHVRGLARMDNGLISIERLDAEMGGGTVSADGSVEIRGANAPKLDVDLQLVRNRIKVFPFQVSQISGGLAVDGAELPYKVSGQVDLSDAVIKEPFLSGGGGASGGRTSIYTPPATGAEDEEKPLFVLDLRARTRGDVRIRNDLFDGKVVANVRVLNTIEDPKILGEAELLAGSQMIVGQNRFNVESAKGTFDNPAVFNPKFALIASTELPEAKVKVFANGSIRDPKIEFSSEPPMDPGQIRSLLGLGLDPEQLAQMSASERERAQQSQGINLIFNTLTQDLNRKALDRWGLEVQLDEAAGVQEQVGQSRLRPQVEAADAGSGAPKLVVKKRFGQIVDISAGSTVPGAEGSAQEQEINAEVQLPKGFSVRGVYNNVQGVQNSANPASQNQQSFGIDLKFRKRFK